MFKFEQVKATKEARGNGEKVRAFDLGESFAKSVEKGRRILPVSTGRFEDEIGKLSDNDIILFEMVSEMAVRLGFDQDELVELAKERMADNKKKMKKEAEKEIKKEKEEKQEDMKEVIEGLFNKFNKMMDGVSSVIKEKKEATVSREEIEASKYDAKAQSSKDDQKAEVEEEETDVSSKLDSLDERKEALEKEDKRPNRQQKKGGSRRPTRRLKFDN